MNVTVYGASSNDIDSAFIKDGEKTGEKLAKAGFDLVFGGGATGLMGAVARGVKRGGGKVCGISPSFFNVDGVLFENADQLILTETMGERKKLLLDKADAILVTPGGLGTFDEFFEVITLRQLSIHKKPIAILNTNGYYDPLIAMLENTIEKGFMTAKNKDLYFISKDPDEIIKYFKNYKPDGNTIYDYKNFKLK